MSTVTVTRPHQMGVVGAKKALDVFANDLAKYGMSLAWSGDTAQIKGTGASGEVRVTEGSVTVVVKLGMVAKMAGVKSDLLAKSIEKRLTMALDQPPSTV